MSGTKQKNETSWQVYFQSPTELSQSIERNHAQVAVELKEFLAAHPKLTSIDILFPCYSGHLRGKRIALNDIDALVAGDIHIPTSISLLDYAGANCQFLSQGNKDGDPDYFCEPIAGTLLPVPWAREHRSTDKGQVVADGERAQILGRHAEPNGSAAPGDPRYILAQQLASFAELGLKPVMALEFEFYLCKMELNKEGQAQMASYSKSGQPPVDIHCNDMVDMDNFDDVISEMSATLRAQGMNPICATKEYSPGQYEINLPYDTDIMRLCDQALLYRRAIKGVAKKYGLNATFMAKPFASFAGSGLHVHISVYDKNGKNIFEKGLDEQGKPLVNDQLLHTNGGAMKHTKDLMILLCPTSNSYRRFMLYGAYAPINSSWNIDDRSAAFRIPLSDAKNTRLEYRIAGSDANPYFVCAALLAAVKDGLANKITPPPHAKVEQGQGMINKPDFPFYWYQSLDNFLRSDFAKKSFGAEHHDRLYNFHLSEFHAYHSFQSRLDITRYFFHL
ncbi:MAG: glutamine synthetase family protein [Alphaproteobacteria bacterium]|nr:glutamine synthetase family protein [Alphaproteobacteria bacterium]